MAESDVFLIVTYSVVAVLVLLSNSIVIIVIVKSQELHLPTIWNIAFMAVWDFSYGLHFLVFAVPSKVLDEFAYSDKIIAPANVLFALITVQNMFNILIALIDRYISVCWPLNYPRLMSAKRYASAVTLLFIINMCRNISLIFSEHDSFYHKDLGLCMTNAHSVFLFLSVAMAPLSGIAIVILLIKLYVELKKARRSVNPVGTPPAGTQFTFTMILSAVVYLVCYLPLLVSTILRQIVDNESLIPLLKFSVVIVFCNSFWNVFIYASTYKPFKDAFLRLFFPSIYRQRAQRQIRIEYQRNTVVSTIA